VLKHRINGPESRPQVVSARAGSFARAHGRPDGVPGRISGARGNHLRRSAWLLQAEDNRTELEMRTIEQRRKGCKPD